MKDDKDDELLGESRLKEIRLHFKHLKDCYEWTVSHDDPVFLENKILPAVEELYSKLETLGVPKTFSSALFVFGGLAVKAAKQFKG